MARVWRGKLRNEHSRKGQSLVEFSLVLPLLLILFLGMAEVGFGMYSYLRVAVANREGVRMASRGRFTDATIAQRVITSGGMTEITPGVMRPYLKTTGPDSNTGIIITHVDIPVTGEVSFTYYVTGTLQGEPIQPSAGKIAQMSDQELFEYIGFRHDVTEGIYEYRKANDYEAVDVERYVIIETFLEHDLILEGTPGVPNPLRLYFDSTMREMRDSRLD